MRRDTKTSWMSNIFSKDYQENGTLKNPDCAYATFTWRLMGFMIFTLLTLQASLALNGDKYLVKM